MGLQKRKNLQRVSVIAKKVIKEIQENCIAYGFWSELHKIHDEAWPEKLERHPILKWQAVLNALDRESKQENAIFEKKYFRAWRNLARVFVLKEGKVKSNETTLPERG